jgi:cysteine desulfurase
MLYLDFAASTPIRSSVLGILEESFRIDFANASASHKLGKEVAKKVENCREFFLKTVKGDSLYDLIFTSSATESNNTIIKGIKLKAGDKVFLCEGDHPSIVGPGRNLSRIGVFVEKIPLKVDSQIDQEKFLNLLDDQVKLIILSEVNNQSGVFNDCIILAKKIKDLNKEIHIHLDAVQSFGKFDLNLKHCLFDSISVSSHKIGGPKGVAGLFIKKNLQIVPLLEGGNQEFGLRSSTLSVPLILGFKTAFLECLEDREKKFLKAKNNFQLLRVELKKRISSIIFPFGDISTSSPFILVFAIPKISSDILLRHLEAKNIYVSSSSACSSKIKDYNLSYLELGLPLDLNKNVLRVSFDERINEDDIFHFIKTLDEIYGDLRHLI